MYQTTHCMKRFFRLFLLTLLVCAPLSLFAQSGARYGYLNRAAVIALLPETARVRHALFPFISLSP